jgi:hypothetical protein
MNIKKDISKVLKNYIKTFIKYNNNGDESGNAGTLSGETDDKDT